ncbi:hypothetical protein V1478_003972 [Vespula squamosa]|uniref:Uncharacterized protein n=1 Tax=Vespula squamosa TaxID=30214 RepID=A0ABD2BNC9_VESSQ
MNKIFGIFRQNAGNFEGKISTCNVDSSKSLDDWLLDGDTNQSMSGSLSGPAGARITSLVIEDMAATWRRVYQRWYSKHGTFKNFSISFIPNNATPTNKLKVELSTRFLFRLFLVGAFLFNKNKLAFGRRCEEGDVGSTEEYGSEKRYTRERFFPPVVPPELNFCRSVPSSSRRERTNGPPRLSL